MLMKCTECGHDVSDKADKCPNCGCPVSEIIKCLQDLEGSNTNSIDDNNFESENGGNYIFCNINGKRINITWLKDIIEGLSETELYHYKYVWSHDMGSPKEQMKCLSEYLGTPEYDFYSAACKLYEEVSDKCDLTYMTSPRFLYELVESDFELKEFYGESQTEAVEKNRQRLASMVKCPYCGSISVRRCMGFVGGMGLFAPAASIGKNWRCKSCGSYF